jgi:hypothetical protein
MRPVDRGYSLLLGTWSHLRYIRGSVLTHLFLWFVILTCLSRLITLWYLSHFYNSDQMYQAVRSWKLRFRLFTLEILWPWPLTNRIHVHLYLFMIYLQGTDKQFTACLSHISKLVTSEVGAHRWWWAGISDWKIMIDSWSYFFFCWFGFIALDSLWCYTSRMANLTRC